MLYFWIACFLVKNKSEICTNVTFFTALSGYPFSHYQCIFLYFIRCHVAVSLPIHLRYQPAHKHFPYYSFFLPPPLLLLQRTNHIPQLSLDTSNSSYSLPCTAHSDDECDWSCVNPVGETWCRQKGECKSTVPRGVQEWTWIVMVVTVCVVNGGTAVLVATMAKIL